MTPVFTSLCCQTLTTQCLTPTVLYTDVDGQCDKLSLTSAVYHTDRPRS